MKENTYLYSALLKIDGDLTIRNFKSKAEAIDWLLSRFYSELGSGDGENGRKGSLWNCAPEIYAFLDEANGGTYEYADVKIALLKKRIRYYFTVEKNHELVYTSPFYNAYESAESSMRYYMKSIITIDDKPSVINSVNNKIVITHNNETIVAEVEEKTLI